MKKALRKSVGLYHIVNGERVAGSYLGLSGDCTELWGDCSGLRGDCSGLRGSCSGLWGDCSGLSGNLDECEITDEERAAGVVIEELIK